MKLKQFLLALSCFLISAGALAQVPIFNKSNILAVGLDLSQFNYMIEKKPSAMNFATSVHYKPFYFLSLNGAIGYNKTHSQREQGYSELIEYESKGSFAKFGFDLSLGLSKRYLDKRIFIGYQWSSLNFHESGIFERRNLYWSDLHIPYKRENHKFNAGELVLGYKAMKFRWGYRIQIYSMSSNKDIQISRSESPVSNFRSPFLPGYGYHRSGINFILMYRLL
ncbi:MAG: hypothetical protein R2852_03165 [Bacteroidia bacterium]